MKLNLTGKYTSEPSEEVIGSRDQPFWIIVDNTPYPNGYIVNYESILVYTMKIVTYQESTTYYTVTYSLVLIASMLFVLIIGVSIRYCQTQRKIKKEAGIIKEGMDTFVTND